MSAYYFLESKEKSASVLQMLIDQLGLPTVASDLSIYLESPSNSDLLHINFTNNICGFRYLRRDETDSKVSERQPFIYLQNKNIKHFLKFTYSIGFNQCHIGEIRKLDFFDVHKKIIASIGYATFVGDLLTVYQEDLVKEVVGQQELNPVTRSEMNTITDNLNLPEETLFDQLGTLNPKIQNFAKRFGIETIMDVPSLQVKVNSMSNNYDFYESEFKRLVDTELIGKDSIKNTNYFKPLSIIIPCFNSENTIVKTLKSIESQSLSLDQKKSLDVILIDDGSKSNLYECIKDDIRSLTIQPRIIRVENNIGLAGARNIGLDIARYDTVLFLDSDILLSHNYLLEHSTRNQVIPNAIFVSLKKNIEDGTTFTKGASLDVGLPVSWDIDDMRLKKHLVKDQIGIHHSDHTTYIEILNDTNYFKDFGFGRHIGCFDLPAMVIGHNMSMRKKTARSVGGFDTSFVGWGLEDTFFGVKAIAGGNYVVPVIAASVYHINHEPRSGSSENKKKEFEKNIERYNKLINTKLDE